jgi:hypothetical protein
VFEYSLLFWFAKSWCGDVECRCSVAFADECIGFTRFVSFKDILSMERRIDLLDKIGNIGTYSTVMTTVKKIITLGENITTGFDFICLGISTERTRKVP